MSEQMTEDQKRDPKGRPDKDELTTAKLDKLRREPPERQRLIWDAKQDGLVALVSPKGKISLSVCYYLPSKPGVPRYMKLGRYPDGVYTYKDAADKQQTISCANLKKIRERVAIIRANAADGINPKREAQSDLFPQVVEDFIELHAKKKNRTWHETRRIFEIYVLPEWEERKIGGITRTDVTVLLDKIEHRKIKHPRSGAHVGAPIQATATLTQLTKLFNWHAARTDKFQTPIVKGMKRGKPAKERARSRVLEDTELRVMWSLLDDFGVYGAVIKCALLTAQRFHKVSGMQRDDLKQRVRLGSRMDGDQHVPEEFINDVWDAVRGDDPKNKDPKNKDPKNKGVSPVPLSPLVRQIINAVPVIDGEGDYVFSLNGDQPMRGWGRFKRRLDDAMRAKLKEIGKEFEPWQHRDLRRTARTLMSKAGVSSEVSERCLGHVIAGVQGVYDRHDYLPEQRDAFAKLAALIERIVHPADNVVEMPKRG